MQDSSHKSALPDTLTIAIVDDDPAQRAGVRGALEQFANCHTFGSAELFFEQLKAFAQTGALPQLVILDWGLPGISGLMAVKELRTQGFDMPVLFLTSRDSEKDIVAALTAGADDYLVKPFRANELAARVKNLLRRVSSNTNDERNLVPTQTSQNIRFFGVEINRSNLTITMPNQAATALTQREFELANYFFERLNEPLSREAIMQAVWRHADTAASRTLDTHISKIRVKLKLTPELGWRLTPVYSYGYRLDVQESI
jgi:two-component system, OmpR family, phosphate regulon response regulator PhoB